MRLELRGHHVDVTPGLRRFVAEKLSKLERLLNDRAVSAHAILTVEKRRHVADITLHARGERFLHGLGDSASWETSLTQAVAKISHQAQKLKTRQKDKRHGLKAAPPPTLARAPRRRAAHPQAVAAAIEPMSVADAAVDAGDQRPLPSAERRAEPRRDRSLII